MRFPSQPLSNEKDKKIRGGVLVEAAFSIVLMLIFLAGLVDLGRMVHSYAVLTETANEAVRLGSRLINLKHGTFSCAVTLGQPSRSCASPVDNKHDEIFGRGLFLMDRHNELDFSDMSLKSACTSTGVGNSFAVTLNIDAGFKAFFPLFDGVRLRVSHTSEHLYP